MAEAIDSYDWAGTPLGPRADWPPTLRLMVGIALASGFPMLVFWGRDLVQVYNDAFMPILGARHPAALGQAARDCWPEIWHTIGPLLHGVLETGEPVWAEDMPLTLERNGYPEQTNFTFSYSRMRDEAGESGLLCTCVETTKSVSRERQFRAMADNIANIVYTHAPDGTVEWANSRWYEYTRLPKPIATTAEGWALVVPPEDLALILDALERAFMTGEAYEAEIRIKPYGSGDDALRWHLLRAVPMRATDGTIVRWAGSATDVHDRHAAGDALSRRYAREHEVSLAFQNVALPQTLPIVPGLVFDAMYEAAGEDALVGGDWYDAFRLPDGRVVISVGDVVGSGLGAAVTMGAVRQVIRGAAQVFPEPAAALDAADRALRAEQPDRIVTAFLGILDPLTRVLSYASAGHPPPLLRRADGSLETLAATDLPLGLRNERPEGVNHSVVLSQDALLVLYTDGLTEATRDAVEGERRLREALALDGVYRSPNPAAAIRRAVVAEANDDVAILTVRVGPDSERMTRWSFRSDEAAVATSVRREFASMLRSAGATDAEAADAELVFGELLGNVVRHTDGPVEAALDMTNESPILHVLDRGAGFTYYARLPKDTLSESGRGLYIATKLARDVIVETRPEGGSHARVVLAARKRRTEST
jgi:PAS domain-containing protein/anti-sigma regulatory factor (Ser/Thr protein kinase)